MSMKEKKIIEQFFEEPGRIFGLLYPFILTLVLIIGLYYLDVINFIGKQKVPVREGIVTIKSEDIQLAEARVTPAVNIESIVNPDETLLSRGKELYKTSCSSCHGDDGKGDGVAGAALNPPPKNFTAKDGWKNSTKISGIYTSLYEGIPGTGMAMFDYLPPEDLFAISHYVRTFITDPPSDTQDDFDDLDFKYNLSQGVELPAQIPVLKAKELISSETLYSVQRLYNVLSVIDKGANQPGAIIFNNITVNREKAVASLLQNSSWKAGENQLVNLVTNNLISNGFSGSTASLSEEEWSVLYTYLRNVF